MGKPFVESRRVEFRDTDAAGIAHFSVFFVWMEQAEHAALRDVGLSVHTSTAEAAVSWPRVSAKCDYRNPVRFEDKIDTEVSIHELGTRSVTYRFLFTSSGREIATGSITTVCCRFENGRWASTEIPPDVRQKLERLVPEPMDS